ncbi:MAG: hypothetical protein BGN83_15955 [Rhizobium sp. 63-7]|nr:MAG: hypothetical protein BGN83_15955 [Rhizobium sp. 63-7]
MTYALIAPPVAEPVTLAEVKAHLRLDGDDEDVLLGALVKVAREHLERCTGLLMLSQAWRLYLDDWPVDGVIRIARGPVQSVETVVVYDEGGAALDVPLDGHVLDGGGRPARLVLNQCVKTARAVNGIEIDFVAGFGDAAVEVPDTLRRAMLLHVAHMFAYRGVVPPDSQPASVPAGYELLVAPYLLRRL